MGSTPLGSPRVAGKGGASCGARPTSLAGACPPHPQGVASQRESAESGVSVQQRASLPSRGFQRGERRLCQGSRRPCRARKARGQAPRGAGASARAPGQPAVAWGQHSWGLRGSRKPWRVSRLHLNCLPRGSQGSGRQSRPARRPGRQRLRGQSGGSSQGTHHPTRKSQLIASLNVLFDHGHIQGVRVQLQHMVWGRHNSAQHGRAPSRDLLPCLVALRVPSPSPLPTRAISRPLGHLPKRVAVGQEILNT